MSSASACDVQPDQSWILTQCTPLVLRDFDACKHRPRLPESRESVQRLGWDVALQDMVYEHPRASSNGAHIAASVQTC